MNNYTATTTAKKMGILNCSFFFCIIINKYSFYAMNIIDCIFALEEEASATSSNNINI